MYFPDKSLNQVTEGSRAPYILQTSGPTLENKGMGAFFQKKGKEMLKKSKIFEKSRCKNRANKITLSLFH